MNCPCDSFVFPPRLYIRAGLAHLPRQIASFPEFRRALLHDSRLMAALADWRGRQEDDFGVLLVEMWAYICDVTAFYDEVLAQELYVRTANRRPSLRQLTALLGYRPRPAVGATVDLAAFADGRQTVLLPAGTAFRSDAFSGNPPQTFELEKDVSIHPFFNKWELQPDPVRLGTFGGAAITRDFLLCANGTASVKKEDLVLIRIGSSLNPRSVTAVSDFNGSDGARYTKVEFDADITIPANQAVRDVALLKPTLTAALWPMPFDGRPFSTDFLAVVPLGVGLLDRPHAYLDSIYSNVRAGQCVVFAVNDHLAARLITATSQQDRTQSQDAIRDVPDSSGNSIKVPIPASLTSVTRLELDRHLDRVSGFGVLGDGPFVSANVSDIAVHLNFISAGDITVEAFTVLQPTDQLAVPLPIERPIDADPPGKFQLEDKNLFGAEVDATLNFDSGNLHLGQDAGWHPALAVPVRLFGNILTATRGESVTGEQLGLGDATQAGQTFKLKKSPLTYFPAPNEATIGAANTLKVYVDGLQWAEVPSFFNVPDQAQVYVVRENDAGESSITFGDGVRGSRLPTGARVTANYRFGAGAAAPPAGGIHQLARPAKGLTSIRNPVPAHWGGDAEPAEQMRKYAPRSALLLGRAVSLADLEAATACTQGVRAVRAEWCWNPLRQRPVAQIYYIGDPGLDPLITQQLRALTEPDTPIDVTSANPLPRTLALQVTINTRYLEADVLPAVRSALMDPDIGPLAPELIGIGLPLFLSRIYECVLGIPGTDAITDVQFESAPFSGWGITPGTGNYFDFEQGTLLLNGKNADA